MRSESTANQGESFWAKHLGLLLWLIMVGFGGGLLTVYYADIGYFPEIEWEASLTYLAAMSAIGVLVFVLYSLSLFIPGLIWSEVLVFDDLLRNFLCRHKKHPKWHLVILVFGIPFFLAYAMFHVALLAYEARLWSAIVSVIGAFLISSVWVWFSIRKAVCRPRAGIVNDSAFCKKRDKVGILRLAKRVVVFEFSLLASLVSLVAIHFITAQAADKNEGMLAACTLIAALTNVLVAIYFRKGPPLAVGSAVSAGLLLLVLGNVLVQEREDRLSSRILRLFGIGFGREATLVLKPEGIKALPKSQLTGDSKNMVTAEILSRLGPELFLRIKSQSEDQYLYVSLPKDKVLSWSVKEPRELERIPDKVESTALAKNRQ